MADDKPLILRPTKTRNEQKIKGKNPSEIVANTVLALSKEWGDFLYAKLTEYPAKFIGGRPFAPVKVEDAIREVIDPFNKDSILRKVANAAMAPFSYMRDIQQGVQTDQNAKKEAAKIEAAGLAIIAKYSADPKTLTQEENTWLVGHLERCFAGKTSTDTELDSSVARLAQLHLYSLQGRGVS